jgi:hypothetical protein
MIWVTLITFLARVLAQVLFPLLLGVLSSFLVVLVVESLKRPRLVLSAEAPQDASYRPGSPATNGKFVRVLVRNEQLP